MSIPRIVVIGASAGGIEALPRIVGRLPPDFPSAVCVVLHTSPDSPGVLEGILDRAGPLRATSARNLEPLRDGHIYVAPPDYHLMLEPGRVRVTKGPQENLFRPAIDPLFRSAAQVYGPAAIGVILTGNLDDGVAGLWAIKRLGGITVVQDPAEAAFSSMPLSAVAQMKPTHIVRLDEMAPLLTQLVATPVHEGVAVVNEDIDIELKIAKEENPQDAGVERLGEPSRFACPECHGVLLQLLEERRPRFRCHTGHAYSIESLLAGINEGIEDALLNAIRTLEEGSRYLRHMAGHFQGDDRARAERLAGESLEARRHSDMVRQVAIAREALKST